uniref:3-ketoacyl-CoA thiolase, mitochondrial-like n=1 Tax=Sinocyclocheilus rhinocerous TaxID=307959 RepID=A0A673FJV9_9TELE
MCVCVGVFIVSAKRTPFGTYGGVLKDHSATDLAEHAAKAALVAGNVAPELVNSVIVGNVMLTCMQGQKILSLSYNMHLFLPYLLKDSQTIHFSKPLLCVTLICGDLSDWSHFHCIMAVMPDKAAFVSSAALCTALPGKPLLLPLQKRHLVAKNEFAFSFRPTRKDQQLGRKDCYGEAGHYNAEIAPIDVKAKKGKVSMTSDEHPRPQTTLEQMAKLPSVFKKGGTVTAANASGVSDGAAAVVLASEDALKAHKLTPLARIVAYHTSGCDPSIMGIGPVPAITEALKKAGLSLEDMDLVEVNEAFASQYLAVAKALGLDPAKTNVNGGAIAIGHPLGASGTRITAHLVHELRRRGGKYAVGSACIGGGQGIAIVLENTN